MINPFFQNDGIACTNGAQHQTATAAALAHPVTRVWKGYWQR